MAFNPGTGLYGGGLTNGFGNLTGNVTGNLVGNVVGNVTGDVVGDLTGNVTGDVTGTASGNLKLNSSTAQNISGAQINFTNSGVVFDNEIVADIEGVATGNLKQGDSVINLGDVTDPGSGRIITVAERDQITANQTAITGKANDSDVVKLSGAQNISGEKGFTNLVARGDGTTTGQSGKLLLKCSNNNHGVTIQSPAHSANATYTLTLPTSDGNVDQVLQTNGSGVLSWVDLPTGGGGGGLSSIILSRAETLLINAASSLIQFKVNEAPLGKDITLTPQSTNLSFNPASITLTDSNQTSADFEITATAGAGTTPAISVAISNPATNTQISPITVDQNLGPALTIIASPPISAITLSGAVNITLGGSASSSVTFVLDRIIQSGTLYISLSSASGISFSTSSFTIVDPNDRSSSFTITASSSVAAGTYDITCNLTGTPTPTYNTPIIISNAITVASAPANLPWRSSSTTHGWYQIKNLPTNTTSWFPGDDLNSNEILFDYATGNSSSNNNVWSRAAPSTWQEVCVQTMDAPNNSTNPTYWFIATRTSWETAIQSSGAVALTTVATNSGLGTITVNGYSLNHPDLPSMFIPDPPNLPQQGYGQTALYVDNNYYNGVLSIQLPHYYGMGVFVR